MNPVLEATLRRNWPLVGAAGLFAIFMFVHQVLFQPAAKRYVAAIKKASELGLALDPTQSPAVLPPRVFALVADNTLPAAEAQDLGNSGVLTARLLEDLTRVIGERGMEVIMTEPGAVTQQSRAVQVRAYLRVRGRYGQFVSLLDGLARGRELIAIDRFTLTPQGQGQELLDLWVSRLILKQETRKK